MEFDKSKVYTALNADEVKNGSMGYFADTINGLRDMVEQESRLQYGAVRIRGDYELYRFHFKCNDEDRDLYDYNLFYLVEEPKIEEPKKEEFRSYNDVNEMIEDFEKRFYLVPQALNLSQALRLPQIWIKGKPEGKCKDEIVQVVGFYKDLVTICRAYDVNEFTLYELFDHFTYLDGSPCGIKED